MQGKTIYGSKKIVASALLVLFVAVACGFMWGHKDVRIEADGQSISVSTFSGSPEKILSDAGIWLGDKDEYRLSSKQVENQSVITVYRAVPASVTYQGKESKIITGKPTVGELLSEMGIVGEAIRVEPDQETKITADIHIKVVNVSEKIIEREEQVPYGIERRPDPSMEQGSEEVLQYGEDGVKAVKVKEHFDDGVKVAEETVEETVLRPAQPQVVRVGTRDTIDTSRGAMRFSRSVYMEATAYLPSDGGGSGITATGMQARHGIVAVDPNVIPLGTRLYIPGYGTALAADTGGAIRGNIIDLCMEDYGDAINFGRRTVKVYILR